jgi:NMD protein affecting ribosome stability and mRNA decay
MSPQFDSSGFHPIRHDRLLQERVHDAYKLKGKLQEPSVCTQCGAIFHQGRWQWSKAPVNAHETICPACHRILDRFPAGLVTLEGKFFNENHVEILNLVHNEEKRERAEHPLKRIMAVEKKGGGVLVTTTDIHLARSIGDAVHHAYQGKLEYHYNPEQNLLRVNWSH